jgi:predicted nucleic acid-binding protein
MIAVDANVVLPLLREDALTGASRDVRAVAPDWVVPSLLKTELANALLKDVKAGFLTIDRAKHAAGTAADLIGKARVVDPPLTDVLLTAQQSGLTAYDATYVVLARSLGAPLVTEDKQILRACPDVARSMKQFLAPPETPATVREKPVPYRTSRARKRGGR